MPEFEFHPGGLERVKRLMFSARLPTTTGTVGPHRTSRAGEGQEFLDYRPYASGDDFRTIDWALYGRLRELFVRVNQAEECLYVTILVDVSSSMCFGRPQQKVQLACQLTCGLAYIALAEGDRLQVAPFATDLRALLGPMQGIARVRRVVDHLHQTESGGPTDFNAAVAEYCRRRKHRGLVVVISDLLGPGDYKDAIRLLMVQRERVLLIHVLDDLDFGHGLQGFYRMRDSETGREIDVEVDATVRRSLVRRLESYAEGVAAFARQCGQGYIQARTRDRYVEILAQAQRMKVVRL